MEIAGASYSYRDIRDGVLRTASLFRELGVGRGDRVCLFMPNAEYLYCWFGLSELGAVSVPINTAYRRDETAYILNNAEAVATGHRPVAGRRCRGRRRPGPRHPPSYSARRTNQRATAGRPSVTPSTAPRRCPAGTEVSPDDVSMLVYTSGTTGNPKGVMVTHRMYAAAGQGFAHWTQATPDDRFFTCLPFYHANIQYYSTMGALAAGATLVIVDRFSASRFWGQVREAKRHSGQLHRHDDARAGQEP